jgi:hypothetical protein
MRSFMRIGVLNESAGSPNGKGTTTHHSGDQWLFSCFLGKSLGFNLAASESAGNTLVPGGRPQKVLV